MPELDDAPTLPDDLLYLWEWFLQLHRSRGGSGFGLMGITYEGIRAWCDVTGAEPHGWEIEAIKRADNAYCDVVNEPKAKPESAN